MRITTIRGKSIDLVPGVTLEGAMLRDLNLAGIDLAGSCLRECFFNESNLANASLRSCDLSGSVFFRTNLIGADLSEATLHRCYWNEVIHDSTTRWPDGFSFPNEPHALIDPDGTVLDQYFPTGLCTAGVIPMVELDIAPFAPASFVPVAIPFGRVSEPTSELLFLRLATLVYRACKLLNTYRGEYDELPFSEDELIDIDDYDDLIFTHICLSLLVMGIEVQYVLDQQRIEVTFTPRADLPAFLDSPLIRLFILLYENLSGLDHDDAPDFDNASGLDSHSHVTWKILDDRLSYFDTTRAFTGEVREIELVTGPQQSDDPRTEISRPLLRYLITMAESEIVLEDGDHNKVGSRQKIISKIGYVPDVLLIVAWHLMGVEEISRRPDGTFRAILCPRMDVEDALREIDYLEPGEDENQVQGFTPYATRPKAGRFSGHLK